MASSGSHWRNGYMNRARYARTRGGPGLEDVALLGPWRQYHERSIPPTYSPHSTAGLFGLGHGSQVGATIAGA